MNIGIKIFLGLLAGLITLIAIMGLYYTFVPSFNDNLHKPKYMSVRIKLKNECTVGDDTFIVESPTHNRTSKFYNGVAKMRLPTNAKVKLSVSPEYPNFEYDSIPESITTDMILVADCSVSPRLKSIFGAMQERFGQ